jgi:plastocyanin
VEEFDMKSRWLWLIGGIAFALFTTTPVIGAYLPVIVPAAPSGGGSTTTHTTGTATGPSVPTTCGNPCVIVIKNSAFGSGTQLKNGNGYIIIAAGTTVIWENRDNTQHTTTSTSNPPLWDSGIMNPGQNFNFTFSSTGTYNYICNVHPMAGTVIVVS